MQDEFLKRIQMRKIKKEGEENLEGSFNYLIMMIGIRKKHTNKILRRSHFMVSFLFYFIIFFILILF